jgi:transcriptional regulator with XRE-family HTH domain
MTFKRVPREARIIGANIRYLREAAGLSQQDIAKILGLSYQQVQKYECGLNRFPVEKLFSLKHFYDVPYELFFRDFPHRDTPAISLADPQGWNAHVALMRLQNPVLRRKIEKVIFILTES